MPENLWGELPLSTPIRTPTVILQEQANTLTELTKGTLVGRVNQGSSGLNFVSNLIIVAPALNNYSYSVLTIQHQITLYPLILTDNTTSSTYNPANEDQFVIQLRRIPSSDTVKRAILGLVSQIRVNADQEQTRTS
jgi:hypothetical protein